MMPTILHGDARSLPLRDGSVDLIVTSPPYFNLRRTGSTPHPHSREEGAFRMVDASISPAKNPGEFTWHGPHGKGAMRGLREIRRGEAEARNAAAQPVEIVFACGHKHGSGRRCAA